MERSLLHSLELLTGNRQILAKSFRAEYNSLLILAAGMYASKNAIADPEKIRKSTALIKSKTNNFSTFRSSPTRFCTATMLSLEPEPEKTFDRVLSVYGLLRKNFSPSFYLASSAYMLASCNTESEIRTSVGAMHDFYRMMKSDHSFLTTGESIIYAALAAASGISKKEFHEKTEIAYLKLKGFFPASSRLLCSYLIALSPYSEDYGFERTVMLYERLRAKGLRYGKHHELPMLTLLALTGEDVGKLASEMKEINCYLRAHRGFGASLGTSQRLMFAALRICADRATDGNTSDSIAINGAAAEMLARQQAATMAAIASSTVVVVSASSN